MNKRTLAILGILLSALIGIAKLFGIGSDDQDTPALEASEGTGEATP